MKDSLGSMSPLSSISLTKDEEAAGISVLEMNKSNITEPTDYVPYEKRVETYLMPLLLFIISCIGVAGNGVVVWSLARHREIRTQPNIFIMSMALGDILVLVGSIPFVATVYVFDSWPHGEFMCKVSQFLQDFSLGVTVLTLVALSVDRWYAIAMPLRRRRGEKRTLLYVVVVWVIAVLVGTPVAYSSYLSSFNSVGNRLVHYCYPYPPEYGRWYPRTVVLVRFILYYMGPLLIIGLCNAMIAYKLHQGPISTNHINSTEALRVRMKIAKIVLVLVLVFALSMLPRHVYLLWFHFFRKSYLEFTKFWHIFKMLGFVLFSSNSCVNPIVLYFTSATFRHCFKSCCKTSSSPSFLIQTSPNNAMWTSISTRV